MNILCVCTGNINRSVAAEVILRALAPDDWRVSSAGVSPNADGHLTAPKMRRALTNAGYSYPDPPIRSRVVTPQMIQDADVILYMQPSHAIALRGLYGAQIESKLVSAGGLIGLNKIPDPHFATGDEAHRRVVWLLQAAAMILVAEIVQQIAAPPCAE